MAEEKYSIERYTAILRDVISAVRDGVIFLVFVLLLFFPGVVNNRLTDAGFTKAKIGDFEWQSKLNASAQQTKVVGESVSRANSNYQTLIDRLAELETTAREPAVKDSLQSLGAEAKTSQSALSNADQAVKKSLSDQLAIVAQFTPTQVSTSGWLFLGKVSEDKTSWAAGSPETVMAVPTPVAAGAALTIRDDAYLRADGNSAARAAAAILTVVKAGETVIVDTVDYSHARGGGWFAWARVHR
jgi:hypothetical protein